jgi:RNA polymerase sigma factor (sigma-70 family)
MTNAGSSAHRDQVWSRLLENGCNETPTAPLSGHEADASGKDERMSQADQRRVWVLRALDEYEGRLLRYALRLLGGELDLARDAVQHAFLKLCDAGPAGPADTQAAWLFRVCRNRAVDHLRQAGRERPLGDQSSEEDGAGRGSWRLAGREPDPAGVAEAGELAGCLHELLGELPAPQREAIDLWCEGFAYRQIAEITGRKEGHIRVLVHRGLATLREHPQVRNWLSEEQDKDQSAVGNALRGVP